MDGNECRARGAVKQRDLGGFLSYQQGPGATEIGGVTGKAVVVCEIRNGDGRE